VFGLLKSLLGEAPPAAAPAKRERAPEFPVPGAMARHEGYPVPDWAKVHAWVDGLMAKARRAEAWTACERAWLLHFRDALGPAFRLDESAAAAIVSSLEPNVGQASVEFIERTGRRIDAVLKGIVENPPPGRDILIAFDDEESYYRYVSYYYPETGEFAFSGGMHIDAGCGHFVTVKREMRVMEATIVHEMTHAGLEHLPLPAWLNEGLAVNTERRLAGAPRELLGGHEKLHDRLRRFWSVLSIQKFWSGEAFHDPESQALAYELARIVVEQLARDWKPFAGFVRRADRADAGAAAARERLGLDLGELVTALLERDTPKSWSPDPQKWEKR